MALWTVAYNLPTQSWTSGGKPQDYDQNHYDVFQVEAEYREQAEAAGLELRRKIMRMSPGQQLLLTNLMEEARVATAAGVGPGMTTEILDHEVRQARKLADLGLIKLHNDYAATLTPLAFNASFKPKEERRAAAGQHRLEKNTAPAGGRRKIGRL